MIEVNNRSANNRFSWKLFGAMLLLVAVGALAKIPAAIFIEKLVDKPELWPRVTGILFAQDFLVMGLIPAGLGLLLRQGVGLEIPLIEKWVNQKRVLHLLVKF